MVTVLDSGSPREAQTVGSTLSFRRTDRRGDKDGPLAAPGIDHLVRRRGAPPPPLRQAEERLRLGSAWGSGDFVFTNKIGNPVGASLLLRHYFLPLLQRAGLPRMRFHDLRHSAATLLLAQGTHPKIVAEMRGHSASAQRSTSTATSRRRCSASVAMEAIHHP